MPAIGCTKAKPLNFGKRCWGVHFELRNGDRAALSKPIALRSGATMALEVAVVRRDGFDGEIELGMDNLPQGITASGLKIPAGKTRGMILITAAENAPRSFAVAKMFGYAPGSGSVAAIERKEIGLLAIQLGRHEHQVRVHCKMHQSSGFE